MKKGRKFNPNDVPERFRAGLKAVLPQGAETVLSALSGGADSTALLHLMTGGASDLGFSVAAAHLDHGLRGEDGAKDLEFARQMADSLGVPFYSDRVDCREMARKTGMSLEEAARTARYSFLEKIRREIGADAVAVGHTADDNAELVLMNLLRGAGPQGLAGIQAARGRIIRPLLTFWRKEIVDYLTGIGLSWVEDSTNRDIAFTRNRIRRELIPFLEKNFNPSVKEALNRTAGLIRDEEAVWDRLVVEAKTRIGWRNDGDRAILSVSRFNELEPALARRLVREAARVVLGSAWGLSMDHTDAVLALTTGEAGRIDLPGDLEARLEAGELSIGHPRISLPARPFQYPLPLPGRVEIRETGASVSARIFDAVSAPALADSGPETALLDLDAITPPLVVRSRRPGDRFQPLGMNGTKTISDFFTDNKIAVENRDTIPLVEDAGGIVWVCGLRPAEWAKVASQTTRFLLLSLEFAPVQPNRLFLSQE